MLDLVKTIKEGADPQVSKALTCLVDGKLAPLVNKFIGQYYNVFKDYREIKGYIYEGIWLLSEKFKGSHPAQFVNLCNKGLYVHLNYLVRQHTTKTLKINRVCEVLITSGIVSQHDNLLVTIANREAFKKTYNEFIDRKCFKDILTVLAKDPYIATLKEIREVTGDSKQNLGLKMHELQEYYGGVLHGESDSQIQR